MPAEETIAAFIQSVPKRAKVVKSLERQLAASDLGGSTTLVQAPGTDPWKHFFDVLEAMCNCDADWVIRFEDDAIASPYLKHNCLTWPAARRPAFGAGWLYSAPGSVIDIIYHQREGLHRNTRLEGSVAVLFKRETLRDKLMQHIRWWAEKNPVGYAFDFAISIGVKAAKHEVWKHDPPIVEHNSPVGSAFGHHLSSECCTRGAFNPRFRRRA